MTRRERSKGLFEQLPATPAREPDPSERALLTELVETGRAAGPQGLMEPELRRRCPDLHFRLRGAFGSYAAALAMALKLEIGERLGREELLAELQRRFGTGELISLEQLLLQHPRLAQVAVAEFGSLAQALVAAGIDPEAAGTDRRWSRERVLAEFFAVWQSGGGLEGELLLNAQPVLAEAVRLAYGGYAAFAREYARWLDAQPLLLLHWGRNQLSRMLALQQGTATRAGKGKAAAELDRVRSCTWLSSGRRPALLTGSGLLYPLAVEAVPLLTTGEAGLKNTAPVRAGSLVAMVELSGESDCLAMVTTRGRLKLLPLSQVRRLRSQGTTVISLTAGDQVACASVVAADAERIVVVTRSGRAVAADGASFKRSSRRSGGYLRVRETQLKGEEPVAVVGLRPGEDLALLGRDGLAIRLRGSDATVRRGPARGRQLWRNQVVAAAACPPGGDLLVTTRRGRLLRFPEAHLPLRQTLRQGVMAIRLEADDAPVDLTVCRPRESGPGGAQ